MSLEPVTECPDCEGKDLLERADAEDSRKWLQVFPRLCGHFSGTGKVVKPSPGTEGS